MQEERRKDEGSAQDVYLGVLVVDGVVEEEEACGDLRQSFVFKGQRLCSGGSGQGLGSPGADLAALACHFQPHEGSLKRFF